MNISYPEEELVRKATYKDFKKTIVALSITLILFILVVLSIGTLYYTSHTNYPITHPQVFNIGSVAEFNSFVSTYTSNPNIPYLLLLFVLSIAVSTVLGVSETISSKHKPKNLSQIISTTRLVMKVVDNESQEKLLFRVEDGILELCWHTNTGPVHNWKLLLTLYVPKITNSSALIRLPKFLLMNEVIQADESHSENKKYQKTIFVREWIREEYIIHFWLKNLKNV